MLGNKMIPYGTAIATFENGRYPQAYRNSGIYIGQGPKGIYIIDQWPGNLARARTLGLSGEPQNNANAYSVISVPFGTTSSKCSCGG